MACFGAGGSGDVGIGDLGARRHALPCYNVESIWWGCKMQVYWVAKCKSNLLLVVLEVSFWEVDFGCVNINVSMLSFDFQDTSLFEFFFCSDDSSG